VTTHDPKFDDFMKKLLNAPAATKKLSLKELAALYSPHIFHDPLEQSIFDVLGDVDFSALEKRILASMVRPSGKLPAVLMGIDIGAYGELTTIVAGVKRGDIFDVVWIDDLYNGPPLEKLEIGHIDRFRFIESPLAVEPEEPRAKNGKLANRKTEQAKAKLPFYHKNRRF
jgi:hypothetical protein